MEIDGGEKKYINYTFQIKIILINRITVSGTSLTDFEDYSTKSENFYKNKLIKKKVDVKKFKCTFFLQNIDWISLIVVTPDSTSCLQRKTPSWKKVYSC